MDMNCIAIKAHLATLLRSRPRGASAELTEDAFAYWNGIEVVGVRLCADASSEFDERFDLDGDFCSHAHKELAAWFANPRYSWRLELLERLQDAPFDRGASEPY
jgi:hypothetical protein